ncbi:MAG: hypothetical protein ACFFDB_19810 [Promethearchaeota archaeon]
MTVQNNEYKTVYLIYVREHKEGQFVDGFYLRELATLKNKINPVLQQFKIPIKVEVRDDYVPLLESWYDPQTNSFKAYTLLTQIETKIGIRNIIGLVNANLRLTVPYGSYFATYSPHEKYNKDLKKIEHFGVALVSEKKCREYSLLKSYDLIAKLILKYIGHIFGLSNNCLYNCLMREMHDVKTIDLTPFVFCGSCAAYLRGETPIFKIFKVNEYITVSLRILKHTELNVIVNGLKLDPLSWWRQQLLFVDKEHKVHPWEGPLDPILQMEDPIDDFNRLSNLLTTWVKNGYDQTLPLQLAVPLLKELASAGDSKAAEKILEFLLNSDTKVLKFYLENNFYKCLNSEFLERLIIELLRSEKIFLFFTIIEEIESQSLDDYDYDEDEEEIFEEEFKSHLDLQLRDSKTLEGEVKTVLLDSQYNEIELRRIKSILHSYIPISYKFISNLIIKDGRVFLNNEEVKNADIQKEKKKANVRVMFGDEELVSIDIARDNIDETYNDKELANKDKELADLYDEINKDFTNQISIEEVLGSKSRLKILRELAQNKELTISLIINKTRMNYNDVIKHLNILMDFDFVQEKKFGRIRLFRYKEENAKALQLKELFNNGISDEDIKANKNLYKY